MVVGLLFMVVVVGVVGGLMLSMLATRWNSGSFQAQPSGSNIRQVSYSGRVRSGHARMLARHAGRSSHEHP